jgi:hypothetical protein
MRALLSAGTPKELAARGAALLGLLAPDVGLLMILILPPDTGPEPTSSTGLAKRLAGDGLRDGG